MRRTALLAALLLCTTTPVAAAPLWTITDTPETVSVISETTGDATLGFYCEKQTKTVNVVLEAPKPIPEAETVEVRVISGQDVSIRRWEAEEGVATNSDDELVSDLMTGLLEHGSLRVGVVGTESVFPKGNLEEAVDAFTRGCGR